MLIFLSLMQFQLIFEANNDAHPIFKRKNLCLKIDL